MLLAAFHQAVELCITSIEQYTIPLDSITHNTVTPHTTSLCKDSPHTTSLHKDSPHTTSLHKYSPRTTYLHKDSPHTTSLHKYSPHTTSPHKDSPHITSPHKYSPRTTSLHKYSPRTTSLHKDSPHTTSLHKYSPHTTYFHKDSPHIASLHKDSPHTTSLCKDSPHATSHRKDSPHTDYLQMGSSHTDSPHMTTADKLWIPEAVVSRSSHSITHKTSKSTSDRSSQVINQNDEWNEHDEATPEYNEKYTKYKQESAGKGNNSRTEVTENEDLSDQGYDINRHTVPHISIPGCHKEQSGHSGSSEMLANLEKLSTSEKDNNDDDVGWFFEDGKVPEAPDFQREVVNVLEEFGSKSFKVKALDEKYSQEGKDWMPTNVEKLKSDVDFPKLKQPKEIFPRVSNDFDSYFDNDPFPTFIQSEHQSAYLTKNTKPEGSNQSKSVLSDIDSEFESCFDDTRHVTQHNVVSQNPRAIKKDCVESVVSPSVHPDQCHDEFESCFDEVEFSLETPGMTKTSKTDTKPNITKVHDSFTERLSKKPRDSRSEENPTEEHLENPSCKRSDLETKLNDIISRKSAESLKAKITNRSRHFRTVQSSVNEMQETVDQKTKTSKVEDNSGNSEFGMTHLARDINALLEKFNEKSSIKASNLLNQSRHFKTIKSTVIAMEAMTSHDDNSDVVVESAAYSTDDVVVGSPQCSHIHVAIDFSDVPNAVQYDTVKHLVEVLSHGAQEVTSLVADACWKQIQKYCDTNIQRYLYIINTIKQIYIFKIYQHHDMPMY